MITPLRRVVADGTELLVLQRGRLVFPERGHIALLQRLNHVYDEVNVIGVDITLGERTLTDIRRFDKELERRLQGLLKGVARVQEDPPSYRIALRLVLVFG